MGKKRRISNKLLLISAIFTIAIPSVSYAEEVISPENFKSSSNLYKARNTEILKQIYILIHIIIHLTTNLFQN